MNISPRTDQKTVIWRGFCGRCPQCGQGKLFQSYLKPYSACAACGLELASVRADDGPTWLTTILTGHIAVPMAVYLAMHDFQPKWLALPLMLVATIVMALLILPRAKGVFIGILWRQRQKPLAAGTKYDQLEKRPL